MKNKIYSFPEHSDSLPFFSMFVHLLDCKDSLDLKRIFDAGNGFPYGESMKAMYEDMEHHYKCFNCNDTRKS